MKRLTGRRGTSTVGMALTLPLLGVLVLGAADLGRLAYDLTLVANAVGAGLSDGSMGHERQGSIARLCSLIAPSHGPLTT